MTIIADVKQKTDIVDIIGQYTTLTKAGRTFRGLCPFHTEKHGSFFVYPEQQSWHCFGACNTGGDVFSFIMKKQGVDFGDALKLLAERARITIPSRLDKEPGRDIKDRLHQANKAAAAFFHNLLNQSPAGERARNYLLSRGFTPDTMTKFEVGFSPNEWESLKKHLLEQGFSEAEMLGAGLIIKGDDGTTHDRFRNRIMFPIHDVKGHTTGFGGRVLDDSQQPKYLNSPQTPVFDKSGTLYGIDFALDAVRERNMVVIVEGYMDAVIAHQYGYNNVVASMGTAISESQVNLFKRQTRNMVLALDSDNAGQEAMLRGVNYENMLDTEVKVIVLPPGKDPDEVLKESTEKWQQLVDKALPVTEFTFSMVTAGLDLNNLTDKTFATNKLLPLIEGVKNDVRRDHYLNKLADLTKTDYKKLETALARARSEKRPIEAKTQAIAKATKPVFSNPVEEYCLALLLSHPELREKSACLEPDLFENSENREIFAAWRKTGDLSSIIPELDEAVREHLDFLKERILVHERIDQKFDDLSLRLREKRLRNMERKKELVLKTVAQTGDMAAELAQLQEFGTKESIELGKIFGQRGRGSSITGGKV